MITKDELRAIIKDVVRELQQERQEQLSGRLQKAREAREAKRAERAVGPRSVVLPKMTMIALAALRDVEPAKAPAWRARLIEVTGAKPESARKIIDRAVPRLIEAGMIENTLPQGFRTVGQKDVGASADLP